MNEGILNYDGPVREWTRRQFLLKSGNGFGAAALSSLFGAGMAKGAVKQGGGVPGFPNFAPKAKRVIYLFFSGGPSHIDMFDFKPAVRKVHGMELPESIRRASSVPP